MLHVIPAGTVLVPVTLGDAQTQQPQGLHITLPWPITRVTSMSIQIQNYTMAAANIKGHRPPGAGARLRRRLRRGRRHRALPAQPRPGHERVHQPRHQLRQQAGAAHVARLHPGRVRQLHDGRRRHHRMANSVSDKITDCISRTIEPQGINLVNFQMRQVVLQQLGAGRHQRQDVGPAERVRAGVPGADGPEAQATSPASTPWPVRRPDHRGLRRHRADGGPERPDGARS